MTQHTSKQLSDLIERLKREARSMARDEQKGHVAYLEDSLRLARAKVATLQQENRLLRLANEQLAKEDGYAA